MQLTAMHALCTPIAKHNVMRICFQNLENWKTMSAQCRHIVRPSAWPLTFWTENWHTGYSCPGQLWHHFRFRVWITDRRAGKTCNAAIRSAVPYNNTARCYCYSQA